MALDTITKDTLKGAAIRELQSYSKKLLAGTTATTNIAIAGTKVKKTTIISVLAFDPATPVFADLTSEASITTDGNMQLSTTDTTGMQLVVELYTKP